MTGLYPEFGIRDRLLLELLALALSLRFHDGNSFVRKMTTTVLFLTWSIVTVMLISGHGVEIWVYTPLTAICFYIVGREHEAELHRLLG